MIKKYERTTFTLSVLPTQKEWLESKTNKAETIRNAIAFLMELEAIDNVPGDAILREGILQMVTIAVEENCFFVAPFLLKNAIEKVKNKEKANDLLDKG